MPMYYDPDRRVLWTIEDGVVSKIYHGFGDDREHDRARRGFENRSVPPYGRIPEFVDPGPPDDPGRNS